MKENDSMNKETNLEQNTSVNHKRKIWIISGIAMTVIICITVAIYLYIDGTQNNVTNLLNKGDIVGVSKLYEKKYANAGFEKQQEFLGYIYLFMSQKYDEYNDEKISYNQVNSLYEQIQHNVIEANEIQNVGKPMTNFKNEIQSLKESKDAYFTGVNCVSNKDYENAIEQFSRVSQVDNNYSKAQSKSAEAKNTWKNESLNYIDEKTAGFEYEEALNILKKLSHYFPNDSIISDKIYSVNSLAIDKAIEQAEADFNATGYQKSIDDIQTALRLVGDSDRLNAELEKYSAYIPAEIYNMECTERSNKRVSKSKISYDNTNQTHINAFSAYHRSFGDENQYEVYPLLGKYDTLTFEVYRNNNEYTKKTDEASGINIYGDGMLLKSITVDKNFSPQNYSLDISDVQRLKIEFDSAGSDASKWTYSLPGEIANIIAKKTR